MLPYLEEHFGNPSSTHSFGRFAREGVERARDQVAAALSGAREGVVFTSGGSEADFMALKGTLQENRERGNHVVISAVEHHAVIDTCVELLTEGIIDLTVVPVDGNGIVDPEAVRAAVRPTTVLISVMYANNETGSIQPVAEIGRLARERSIIFHTDAVQCLGKIPVDVDVLQADLVSVSSHKINGPKGVGALWVRPGTRWDTVNHGGGQERARRPGTENVPGIIGFGQACALAVDNLDHKAAGLRALRDRLLDGVREVSDRVRVNGDPNHSLPNTAHFSVLGVDGGMILEMLDARGIAVSAGSACTAGSRAVSHVLSSMGLSDEMAYGSMRVSLGYGNTGEDIAYFLKTLAQVVAESGRQ